MHRPSLTIGIPFHAGLAYLKSALESVLAQQDPEWQLIISDDGERASLELQSYLLELDDARIRYHRNGDAGGMVANWNRLFDLAQGELLCLLHQDDLMLPNYVALMRGLAAQHPEASAFYAGAKIIDRAGKPCFSFADWIKRFLEPRGAGPSLLRGEAGALALLRGNFIMCPTLCFRRAAMRNRRFDPRWKQVQDLELTCGMLIDGASLIGSPLQAYAYRRHQQAATSQQSESLLRFAEESALLDEMAERCGQLGWSRAARIAGGKRIVKLHLYYRILGDLLRLRWGAAGRKWKFLRELRPQSSSAGDSP